MTNKRAIPVHSRIAPTVLWSSSDPSIASVDSTGKVTGKKEGTAIITAISEFNDQWVHSCSVSVESLNHTVQFDANEGVNAPASQTKIRGTDLFLTTAQPTRPGFQFINWNTERDGSGTAYQPGAVYTEESNMTLYAQWIQTGEYKGLQLSFVVDGENVQSLNGIATLEIYINGEKRGDRVTSFRDFFMGNYTYEIQIDITAIDKVYKRCEGGKLTGTVDTDLLELTLYFETGVQPGFDWTVIPGYLVPYVDENTAIEYRHTYTQNARTSPGEEWTLLSEGPIQYEDVGEPYEADNEMTTSATRVLLGNCYFHWCNYTAEGNYYKVEGVFPYRHSIPMEDIGVNFTPVYHGVDGDGSGRPVYLLRHLNGEYEGENAGCSGTGSQAWYKGYVYQDKRSYQVNTYQMIGEWTDILDTSASSVEYRIRLKQYSVTFNGNGGNCNIEGLIKYSGEDLVLPTVVPTRELYNFAGWNTQTDGTGESYQAGAVYTSNEDVVFYAQWQEKAALNLPNDLQVIEEEAFTNVSAEIIRVPANCTTIKGQAFANNATLQRIYVPSTATSIALDAFDGCPNLTIYAPAGSTAIKVAKYNDIPYVEE